MRKISFLFLIPLLLLLGCTKDQNTIDDGILKSYISSHHLNAVAEPNGLYYVETQTGTGASPNAYSQVTLYYKGYLTNGAIFDSTATGLPAHFYLSQTIAGWQEGIPLMKKGGKATLLIPSVLAYGASGYGTIPPNTVLIFDVQLINFQ